MTLPAWASPLADGPAMRAIDSWAIEKRGIGSLALMERAGAGVARAAERIAPRGSIVFVLGAGNNGGDGLVAARLLREAGRAVEVMLSEPRERLSADALANLERLPGPPPTQLRGALPAGAALVVDGLLGTGARGAPREAVAAAVGAIEASGAQAVLAIDIPSGVDASTGETAGVAVRASHTVTFHSLKVGLCIEPGRGHAGAVELLDIGIPHDAPFECEGAAVGLIGERVLDLLPHRGVRSTKFTSGHVVLAGGARGLTGAPCLAALGAQRAGAGYVTVCVPASLSPVFETRLLEAMTHACEDVEGSHSAGGVAAVLEAAARAGSLVLGPGLGRADGAHAFARDIAARAPLPLVLDADGLGAHAGHLEALRAREAPTVLTPHEGELARLLERDSAEVARERLRSAREVARRSGAICVLKGDDTLVVEPSGVAVVSPGASPALATAGTGDVLAGVLGALLATRQLEPFAAAAAAVILHAQAGRRAAARRGADGVIASDVIEELSAVRSRS